MTQYAVLNYHHTSKIAQAIILFISIHKLTWATSQFNSSVLANC